MSVRERPWMKFYPSDWRADPMLRNCSMAARGLWLEMIALCHESERYGYLLVNGKAPTERQLAVQAGATIDEVQTGLAELESEGVFSRDPDGIIYSRRMVKDEQKHDKLSRMGRKGVRAKKLKDNGKDETLKPTLEPTHKGALKLRGQRPERNLSVSRARNCPEHWKPEPFTEGSEAAAIVSTWADTEVARQLERFLGHHRAKGSKFVDWQAAWGTWVRNSVRFGASGSNGSGAGHRNHEDIVLERIERERRRSGNVAAG